VWIPQDLFAGSSLRTYKEKKLLFFQHIKQDTSFFAIVRLDPVDKPRDVGREKKRYSFNFENTLFFFENGITKIRYQLN
jgi:hypothetical protein